jgi:hypothetical protein
MTIKIRLEPDYRSWPLWGLDEQHFDDSEFPQYGWICEIDPKELPLKEKTIKRLYAWADLYDSGFLDSDGKEDFSGPGNWNEEQQQSFWQEGIDLWVQLQQELGEGYEVFYKVYIPSEKQQRLSKNPDELNTLQVGHPNR